MKYFVCLDHLFIQNYHRGITAHPGFLVGEPLGVLQLSGERDLDLGQLRDLGLGLLQLAEEVRVLDGQLLLGGIQVVKGAVGLVSLVLDLVELVLKLLDHLLLGGLEDDIVFSTGP